MKIIIKDKENKNILERVEIPYSQNPVEAILNWCVNTGHKYVEIEWEGK